MSHADLSISQPGGDFPTIEVDLEHAAPHGYTSNKDAYLRRLKRIEGQVRGIARMVEEDKYCIDILTQVAAATKALHAVSLGLVEEHVLREPTDEADDQALVRTLEERDDDRDEVQQLWTHAEQAEGREHRRLQEQRRHDHRGDRQDPADHGAAVSVTSRRVVA